MSHLLSRLSLQLQTLLMAHGGVSTSISICALVIIIHQFSAFSNISPMILAVFAGIALRNCGIVRGSALEGTSLLVKHGLRLGIVLLGVRLTVVEIFDLGLSVLIVVIVCTFGTYFATVKLGRAMGISSGLTSLIAAGTSICGASAVVTISSVRRVTEEEIAYAISLVTVLGTAAMVIYPLLARYFGLSDDDFGLWVGGSIHEIAQVTAAGYQLGDTAGEVATMTKLGRVVLLVPIAMIVAFRVRGTTEAVSHDRYTIPWFILGFFAIVMLNSAFELSSALIFVLSSASEILLILGLAAAGLQSNLRDITSIGGRPLFLALFSWAFIGSGAITFALLT